MCTRLLNTTASHMLFTTRLDARARYFVFREGQQNLLYWNLNKLMASKKHFLQDRTALLLVSGNSFLALAAIVLTALKLSAGRAAGNYIVQCRDCSNVANIDRFTNGTASGIWSFIIFAVMVLVIGLALGYRAYPIKRHLSLVILALTLPLLLLTTIVSNALLAL